jgi:hypothetical protein
MATSTDHREGDASLGVHLTLNEILARRPDAGAVLNPLGFDTCCGGARTLEAAARERGLDPGEILARIEHGSGSPPGTSPCGCRGSESTSGGCG